MPLLVKRHRWVEPSTTSPSSLDKGKGVASPLDDVQLTAETAVQVDLHPTEVGPGHEVAPLVKLKTMSEMLVHP